MKSKKVVAIIFIALSATVLFWVLAKTITHKSKSACHFATGLLDYSGNGYMVYVPEHVYSFSRVPVLVSLPAVGTKAKQDIVNWSVSAGKRGFLVLDLDVDYGSIATLGDVDALYLRIMNIINSLAIQYPVNKDKRYIAGTSAGGMMAILLGLRYPQAFSGVGVASGAALRFGAEEQLNNARGCKIYMVHGTDDEVVPIAMFYATRETLEKNGARVKSSVYPKVKHPVDSRGYRKIAEWFSQQGNFLRR